MNSHIIINSFTHNLKYLREQANLTQDEVAQFLHCSRQAYSHYECGRRAPDLSLLVEIADLYQISTDDLLRRSINSVSENGRPENDR